jgi:hypothetical protein
VTPLREAVDTQLTAFSVYEGIGGGEGGGYHRLGNPEGLPIAGRLAGKIDTSMGNIHQFLSDLQLELTEIEDRLSENLITFVDLEDEQSLTAQEIHNLIGSGTGGTSSSGGYGNGYGNGDNEDEESSESSDSQA